MLVVTAFFEAAEQNEEMRDDVQAVLAEAGRIAVRQLT